MKCFWLECPSLFIKVDHFALQERQLSDLHGEPRRRVSLYRIAHVDIYQAVADRVKQQIESDLQNEEKRQLARICLDWVWDKKRPARPRQTLKRNVMTYAYSSTRRGMADQLRE